MQATQTSNKKINAITESVYFDFQAESGMSKHIGGAKATDQMLDLCHVSAGQNILDVGSGSGISSCYMAEKRNCHVTGIDINPKMVERAQIVAASAGLSEQTDFQVASATKLPFEDNHFDALMCQSVLAFVDDKAAAVREFMRVVKPGGYIAFTEAHWAVQPEADMQKFLDEYAGPETNILPREEWITLLEQSGLIDTTIETHDVSALSDGLNQIRQTGCLRILAVWGRAFKLFATQKKYRDFAKNATKLPVKLASSLGYGIYSGRKPL